MQQPYTRRDVGAIWLYKELVSILSFELVSILSFAPF